MRKTLVGVLVFVALVWVAVVTVGVIGWRLGHDIPELDVSDLVVEYSNLSPDENAYTYFAEVTNTLYWPSNSLIVTDYLKGEAVDSSVVEEIVARNDGLLELINRGIECGRCSTPEVTSVDTPIPYTSVWRDTCRILAARTRLEQLAEQYANATDTCLSLLRFANLIQRDAGCLMDYLVGIANLAKGLQETRYLACDQNTPESELQKLSSALNSVDSVVPGFARAMKVEYRIAAGMVDEFSEGKSRGEKGSRMSGDVFNPFMTKKRLPGYFFQPNKTKLVFANDYRQAITNASLSYSEMRFHSTNEAPRLKGGGAITLVTPNAFGRMLNGLLLPGIPKLLEAMCRAECDVAATRIIVALALFRKKEGHLPATLSELVPGYLSSIPIDSFDGQPFRYVPEEECVYSVGVDLRDSGGSLVCSESGTRSVAGKERWKSEDYVYSLNDRIPQQDDKTAVATVSSETISKPTEPQE